MQVSSREAWHEQLGKELAAVRAIAERLSYTLEDDQPHLKGERYLLGGANKIVVNAHSPQGRVVIKASKSPAGVAEITEEKRVRDALQKLSFAADSLKIPPEISFGVYDGYTVFITEYIEQKEVLAQRPLEERFFMALRALEAQEAFHATTYEHLQEATRSGIPVFDTDAYLRSVDDFARDAKNVPGAEGLMRDVVTALSEKKQLLDTYGEYLAHFDFAPHNIRVDGRVIWILDFTNMRFGNKYESWARLINYLLIHDASLAALLLDYVSHDRGESEREALHLMRIYKAALLVAFYARTLAKTEGNYRALTELRLALWMDITKKIIARAPFPEVDATAYIEKRNSLRSEEEKERQRGFDIK